MTDEQGNAVECKDCADVTETPPSSSGFGWCPKVELGLEAKSGEAVPPLGPDTPENRASERIRELLKEIDEDEPEATDEEMEAIDRDIDEHQDALDAALAADLTRNGKSSVLRDANSVLDEAKHIINNGRKSAYGHPIDNLERIARMWSVIFGIPVSRRQVAQAFIVGKVARDIETPMRDNATDIAGYAGLMEEVR